MGILLPAPITLSIRILDGSISFANSWTARDGSSYVSGSIYVLMPGKRTAKKREYSESRILWHSCTVTIWFYLFFFLVDYTIERIGNNTLNLPHLKLQNPTEEDNYQKLLMLATDFTETNCRMNKFSLFAVSTEAFEDWLITDLNISSYHSSSFLRWGFWDTEEESVTTP